MSRFALAMAAALLLSAPCTPSYAGTGKGSSAAPTPPKPTAQPGVAPLLCAPLAVHAAYLARRWGERPFAPGRVGRGIVVILFVNPTRRTWTLIRVMSASAGCAIGAGRLPKGKTDKGPPEGSEL